LFYKSHPVSAENLENRLVGTQAVAKELWVSVIITHWKNVLGALNLSDGFF